MSNNGTDATTTTYIETFYTTVRENAHWVAPLLIVQALINLLLVSCICCCFAKCIRINSQARDSLLCSPSEVHAESIGLVAHEPVVRRGTGGGGGGGSRV